jgi:hypothetical protein
VESQFNSGVYKQSRITKRKPAAIDVLLPDILNNFFAHFEDDAVQPTQFIDHNSALNTIVPSKLIIKLETLCNGMS